MPGAQLGLDARLYLGDTYDGATIPTSWTITNNVKDLTLNMTKDTADVTTRANNGFKAYIATLKDASVDFMSIFDDADAQQLVLSDAFFDNTQVWVRVFDKEEGLAATTAQGLQAFMEVVSFTRNEQLTEALTLDISLKPTYNLTNPPIWKVIVTP
jgi:predicted secreted protein